MSSNLPNPLTQQLPLVDPKTGMLTEWGFWLLFSMRQGTISAQQSSTLNTVQLVPSGGIVIPDISQSGPFGSFLLPPEAVTIAAPILTGGTVPNGAQLTFYLDQPDTGAAVPAPAFEVGENAFTEDVNKLAILQVPGTRSTWVFGFDGQIWTLKSFATGETTSTALIPSEAESGSLKYQSFLQSGTSTVVRTAEDKLREQVSAADYGAIGGAVDDSAALNAMILAAIAVGGGHLQLLNGRQYVVDSPLVFPAGFNGITIDGNGATITRGASMPAGQGVFDIQAAQGITFRNFTFDGAVTVAVGIYYATFNSNPMYPALTLNTSFWIHGGSSDITFDHVTIQHTGGYAILSDTTSGGNNSRIRVQSCNFMNNRPHLFGTAAAGAIFGSWTGGIFYSGDCSTAGNVGVTDNLTVTDCMFQRNTGNCIWGHNYGYFNFHSSVNVSENSFLDCGLDCIELSCTITGAVTGNDGRRVGYICLDDASQSIPRYLAAANATFIDFGGYLEGVNVTGNSCTSVCGGFASLDGYAFGAVTGNNFRQPQPGDPFYVIDQIALIPAGVVYGFDCANTFGSVGGNVEQGGSGLAITGNTLYGCTAGSIIAIAVRNSKIADNNIFQPGNSTFAPILLGNQSTQSYQRAYSNSITGNRIFWSPATPQAAIIESANWSGSNIPWTAGDYNWIEKNHIFDTGGNAYEVSVAATTSTLTGPQISSSVAVPTAAGFTSMVRVTAADGTGGYTSFLGTTGTEYFRLSDSGALTIFGQNLARLLAVPGAGSSASGVQILNANDQSNTALFEMSVAATAAQLVMTVLGTGTPITTLNIGDMTANLTEIGFLFNSIVKAFIDASGNFNGNDVAIVGYASLAAELASLQAQISAIPASSLQSQINAINAAISAPHTHGAGTFKDSVTSVAVTGTSGATAL